MTFWLFKKLPALPGAKRVRRRFGESSGSTLLRRAINPTRPIAAYANTLISLPLWGTQRIWPGSLVRVLAARALQLDPNIDPRDGRRVIRGILIDQPMIARDVDEQHQPAQPASALPMATNSSRQRPNEPRSSTSAPADRGRLQPLPRYRSDITADSLSVVLHFMDKLWVPSIEFI
jgi:hypothetical protein